MLIKNDVFKTNVTFSSFLIIEILRIIIMVIAKPKCLLAIPLF